MTFLPVRGRIGLAFCAVVCATLNFLTPIHIALASDGGGAIESHLAAGEFGVAKRLAAQSDIASRDQRLSEVAIAQRDGGAKNGALVTLSSISGSPIRSSTAATLRSRVSGGLGGGMVQDWGTVIQLIQGNVAPDTWQDTGDGEGKIQIYQGGVYVDGSGVMKRLTIDSNRGLEAVRASATQRAGTSDLYQESTLRKVSLTKLEQALEWRYAEGLGPSEAMANLAGLQRIQFVFIYPETREVVIAGPAGPWERSQEGRAVAVGTGAPCLQLDDWLVVLRNSENGGVFTCSIDPTEEGLKSAKQFAEESGRTPLKPGAEARAKWVQGLRKSLGRQKVSVGGIDPRSNAARVLVEADYHMKLVGIGLERGVEGVNNYFDNLASHDAGKMNLVRWWFTLDNRDVKANPKHNAFELTGPGVKVLADSEFLNAQGKRVVAADADVAGIKFAQEFTEKFESLAATYPVYAELKNVFDLAIVASILKSQDVSGQIGWSMDHYLNEEHMPIAIRNAAQEVDSVANAKVTGKAGSKEKVTAVISGGVMAKPMQFVSEKIKVDDYGALESDRAVSTSKKATESPLDSWWWD